MKKSIIYLLFTFLIFISACKKVNSEEIKINNNKNDINVTKIADQNKTELKDLIAELGGKMFKENVKILDAEIMNLDGKTSKLADYKNKVIMLNLWATWCQPCRAEMPSMQKMYNNYKNKDFTIIAVSQGENLNTVKNFSNSNHYNFPIFIDKNNEIARSYSTGSIPTTYLINKQGYLIAQFIGGREWNSKEAIDLINELIK